MKGSSTPTLYRPPTDRRQDSTVRRANQDSRSRSRDDRSKISYASVRSNKTSGPIIFGGNTAIKKSQKTNNDSDILSRSEFSRSQAHSKAKTYRDKNAEQEYQAWVWEQEKQMEQDWYDDFEGGTFNQQVERKKLYETERSKNIIAEIDRKTIGHGTRETFHQKFKNQEHSKWQITQLMNSGTFKMKSANYDIEQSQQNRVVLLVRDQRPKFLDGNIKVSLQQQTIQVVKDPNSPMAISAKKGSQLIKIFRQRAQIQKQKQLGQLAGSKMGKLLKVPEKPKQNQQIVSVDNQGNIDYKDSNRFASLLKKQEGVSDFSKNKTMKQQREFLPIFEVRQQLMKVISQNKVVIIVGETGSGKTTQLTQYLHEEGYTSYGIIGCTQPRRVAAVSVAKRVAQEMGVNLGTTVGYSIRFQDQTSDQTVIKYMTDGVLLRESLNDQDIDQYSAIVMDQAHERSLNTDVLFGILKNVAKRRRNIKIIVTSATMNAQKFSLFFDNAPIFNIPGRTFPVQSHFEKGPVEDYLDAAVKKAIAIHVQQPPGDILIFMTGQQDIEATCFFIEKKLSGLQNAPKLLILPIYSQLRSEQQAKIFETSPFRKCIVATNIAETSLTLDGVKYVIDTGLCKMKVYNPRIGMDALQVTPVSQANANQRAGRAGRTGPGDCYRLYSAAIFRNDFFENNIPEIQRTNLCNVVLLLKSLNIDNLLLFDFMDPPPQQTMMNSIYQLWVLGALDDTGKLTNEGRSMAEFPIDPPLSKMLITSNKLGCVNEILTVVSMLSVPSIFFKPKDRIQEAQAAREKLLVPESDHLTYLNIYEQWQKHNYSTSWANDHFLQPKSLSKVGEIRTQLKEIAETLGFANSSCDYNYDLVRKAICSGYFINAAKVKSNGDYVNLRSGLPCKLHPSSALFSLGYIPQYVVYHELVMTSSEYMNCVTTVDPYWLAQMGPMFFEIKGQTDIKSIRKPKLPTIKQQPIKQNKDQGFKVPQPRVPVERSQKSEKDSSVYSFSNKNKNQVVQAGNQLKSPIIRRTTHHNI